MEYYDEGARRYEAKRQAGLSSTRPDGSLNSPECDRQSAAAECFAAQLMGVPFNANVYGTTGDCGYDFVLPLTVEVYHAQHPAAKYLIIPTDSRHADLYICVTGTIETGFTAAGWTTHRRLISFPTRTFGYGQRYAQPIDTLWKMEQLKGLRRV